MDKKELSSLLGRAQGYVNLIDLGNVYGVAVLVKGNHCYDYQVQRNQTRLKRRHIDEFAKDFAIACVEECEDEFYHEVKNAYRNLKEDEAIALIYGSPCGDFDHYHKGNFKELTEQISEDLGR